MGGRTQTGWLRLSPPFNECHAAYCVFREHAERLAGIESHDVAEVLQRFLDDSLVRTRDLERPAALRAALYVLTDLARQRWSIHVTDKGVVEVKRPEGEQIDPRREKVRVRGQELVKRDEQLRRPAVRKFVEGMERSVFHRSQPISVFSLLRDGRELAVSLRRARLLPNALRVQGLREAIDPYLQFVDETKLCEHTGLRLQDIWRYFRHTWTNQYTSTPGRWMAILVRDRSRKFHPVMGIGAIGSPIVQIRERDVWIGWHAETFLESVAAAPSAELGRWLYKIVDGAIDELFHDDFLEAQIINRHHLRKPFPEVIADLKSHSEEQRGLHHRFARSRELKGWANDSAGKDENRWRKRALTHLFRSKRAASLAEMLRARQVLRACLGESPTIESVRALFENSEGRQIVKRVLRKAKADRVGIAMADITVCGAVAPYGQILGGKLVSMLAASPEVVVAYRDRYAKQESEIASSMAGRSVVRPSPLVLLGTTSLYGVGSSQYNRLRMPAEVLGGCPGEYLEYRQIGKSEAYGTSHFSADTVEALVALVQQTSRGQRVNSIFGEGVSPKFRKIRGGLEALGLSSDELLQHGRRRIVYGVSLVRNLREYLVGMDDEPDYLFSLENPERSTAAIVEWWMNRWLSQRIMNDEVLASLDEHTLVRPIRHGGRVILPQVNDWQDSLFDDLAC